MKNKLFLLLTIVFFTLIALGSGSSSNDSKNTNVSSDSDTSSSEKQSVTVEEAVIFEQNGIKITAKGIDEDSIWGQGIKVLIENESDSDVGVGTDALAVNGYMITDLFSQTVTAGEKANATITCMNSQLEQAGIDTIGEVDAWFYLYDTESYSRIYESTDPSVIKTSAYDTANKEVNIDGTEIINQNGIKVTIQYVNEDSFWGKSVLIYVENNSGENVVLSTDDVSINGYMMDGSLYYADIKDGYKSFDELTIFDSTLEENDIEKIETIKLKFNCYDSDSYSNIFETDSITINVD